MNDESSRSHAIFTILFTQVGINKLAVKSLSYNTTQTDIQVNNDKRILRPLSSRRIVFTIPCHVRFMVINFVFIVVSQAKFHTDMPSETVSKIHLVDLAGRSVNH